jgi:hypothetical protein
MFKELKDGKEEEDKFVLKGIEDGKGIVISADVNTVPLGNHQELNKINNWNDQYLFCRAIWVKPGITRLESDLNCFLGFTAEGLWDFIQQFKVSLTVYKRFQGVALSSLLGLLF